MDRQKQKWDYKHGFHGRQRGTDYSTGSGSTHDGTAVDANQLKERIRELFGKDEHDQATRLCGIPTHLAEIQGLLRNFAANSGSRADAEKQLIRVLQDELGKTTLANCPPLALVFPGRREVWVFSRKGGKIEQCSGTIFAETALAGQYTYWEVSGARMGEFHLLYDEYAGWTAFAAAGVRANPARSLVGNFFAGLNL